MREGPCLYAWCEYLHGKLGAHQCVPAFANACMRESTCAGALWRGCYRAATPSCSGAHQFFLNSAAVSAYTRGHVHGQVRPCLRSTSTWTTRTVRAGRSAPDELTVSKWRIRDHRRSRCPATHCFRHGLHKQRHDYRL